MGYWRSCETASREVQVKVQYWGCRLHDGCRVEVVAGLQGDSTEVVGREDKNLVGGIAERIAELVAEGSCCWGQDDSCIDSLSTKGDNCS